MEMYFCPLYSGSSGNALFVQYGNTRLLVDAGKPGRAIADALAGIGVKMETISGVLITHEHSDHIAGAGVLARRYRLPMYATAGTWQGIGSKIGESFTWAISAFHRFPSRTTRRIRWDSGCGAGT